MKNKQGGRRKGAGRPRRLGPKSTPIWCGRMSKEDRELILAYTKPDERFAVLLATAKDNYIEYLFSLPLP